jgi:hypothetical protein
MTADEFAQNLLDGAAALAAYSIKNLEENLAMDKMIHLRRRL